MPKPKKQGRLDRTLNNASFLMNDEGVSYQMSSIAVAVWNQCDGYTETDKLVANTMKTMDLKRDEKIAAKTSINQIITKLTELGLISSG